MAKLKVGDNICDLDGERGLGDSPAIGSCKYKKGDYDKCTYGASCQMQVEVTASDAREHPDMIEPEED